MINTATSKKKIILCGTKYGASYLPAIYQSPKLELAGILAKGSHRSIRIAEQFGVDLFTTVDSITENYDYAVIAINEGLSTQIASDFLKLNKDVIIEHPIHIHNIEALVKLAEKSKKKCFVNSHFPNLPPIELFIQQCAALNESDPPTLICVQCNSRTLFSMLDILMRCFGLFELEEDTKKEIGNYVNCTFRLNGIPFIMIYQKWRFEEDDSADSPLGHQITITYPSGVLSLDGTYGPCLWHPILSQSTSVTSKIYETSKNIPTQNTSSLPDIIQWRKEANQKTIYELMENEINFQNTPEYVLFLCKMWSSLFDIFGYRTIKQF